MLFRHTKPFAIWIISITIAMIFAVFLLIPYFQLQAEKATNIAVIDSVMLKKEALCFKQHEKTAEMLNNIILKMKKIEHTAKSEYAKIQSDKSMTKKQKSKNLAKLEANWAADASKYQEEIQSIKNIDAKLTQYIGKEIDAVIASIAKEKGVDIVVNSQLNDSIIVFYNSSNIDITKQVIGYLNKKLPNINLEKLP